MLEVLVPIWRVNSHCVHFLLWWRNYSLFLSVTFFLSACSNYAQAQVKGGTTRFNEWEVSQCRYRPLYQPDHPSKSTILPSKTNIMVSRISVGGTSSNRECPGRLVGFHRRLCGTSRCGGSIHDRRIKVWWGSYRHCKLCVPLYYFHVLHKLKYDAGCGGNTRIQHDRFASGTASQCTSWTYISGCNRSRHNETLQTQL